MDKMKISEHATWRMMSLTDPRKWEVIPVSWGPSLVGSFLYDHKVNGKYSHEAE
jgi:hypothetical protein